MNIGFLSFASHPGFCMFFFFMVQVLFIQCRVVKRIQGFKDLPCKIHFSGTSVVKQAQLQQLKEMSLVTTLLFAHVFLSSGRTSSPQLILAALVHFGKQSLQDPIRPSNRIAGSV